MRLRGAMERVATWSSRIPFVPDYVLVVVPFVLLVAFWLTSGLRNMDWGFGLLGHPAISLVGALLLLALATGLGRRFHERHNTLSAAVLFVLYAAFYAALGYEFSGNDVIWGAVVGMLCALKLLPRLMGMKPHWHSYAE